MKTTLLALILTAGLMATSYGENKSMDIHGESLVLAGTLPGKLCFDHVTKGSMELRDSYLPGGKVYTEGRDYTVDYKAGTVSRTPSSRIPDYSRHILYGKQDFNHSKYPYKKCCNNGYFVWVDYHTDNGAVLAKPNDQSKYLSATRQKLKAGGPFKIVGYGDSITTGCDVQNKKLIFVTLFIQQLRQKYPQSKITYQDLTIPGYSSNKGLDWFDHKPKKFHAKALGEIGKADLVLIGFGMNDHNKGTTEPEKFKSNLIKLVELTRKKLGAEVILFSSMPPNKDWHYGSHRMKKFASETKEAAEENHCAYVNVYDVWNRVLQRKDQSSLLANNINHPNYFGHSLYAMAFFAMTFSSE